MILIDISNPITLLLLLVATLLLIFLGREIKRPIAPGIALAIFLVLVLIHSIQLGNPAMEEYRSALLNCVTIDTVMIFLTFFSYLWIDDISCKFYKKKNLDNSLDWFWKQI